MKRCTEALALVILLGAVFWFSCYPISDFDEGWHIKLGEIFSATGKIPFQDPLSFTRPDGETPIYSLLPDLLFFHLYRAFGFPGLIVFRAAILTALVGVLAWWSRRAKNPSAWLASALLFSVFAAFRFRTAIRPYLFSYLSFAVILVALLIHLRTKKRWAWWLSMGLAIANAHLHVEWYAGLSIGVVLALCDGPPWKSPYAKWVLGALLGIGLSALVSPIARQAVIGFPLFFFRDAKAYAWINEELFPVTLTPMFAHFLFLGALGLASAAWLFARRKNRRLSVEHRFVILLPALWLLYALRVSRNAPYAAIAMAPLVLEQGHDALSQLRRRVRPVFANALVAGLVLGSFGVVQVYRDYGRTWGLNEQIFSVRGMDFLKTNLPEGNMFNTFELGGILALWLHPQKKVFIDGRLPTFPAEFFIKTYLPVREGRPGWEEILSAYDVQFCVLEGFERGISRELIVSDAWSLIYWDPQLSIFVRRGPRNQALIERFGYHVLNPFAPREFFASRDPGKPRDLARLLENAPQSEVAQFVAAGDAMQAKDWDRAQIHYANLLAMGAKKPFPAAHLGEILMMKKQPEKAEVYFRLEVERNPKERFPVEQLVRYYRVTGRTKEAEEWTKRLPGTP